MRNPYSAWHSHYEYYGRLVLWKLLCQNTGKIKKTNEGDIRKMLSKGIFYCNRCNQRFLVSPDNSDYVHTCNAPSATINKEDIVNVSTGTDYTGSVNPVGHTYHLGMTNKIAGTRGHLEYGKRLPPLTKFANDATVFRTRQHEQYQILKDIEVDTN